MATTELRGEAMNLIQPLDLGPHAFSMTYRGETKDEHWVRFHAHQGVELLYVHEGAGTATLERRTFPLRPGTLFCFQPYQLHKIEVPARPDGSYVRSNLTFDPRIAEPLTAPFPKLHAFLRRLWKGTLTQQVFALGSDDRLPQLLASFHEARRRAAGEPQDEERALFLLALLRHLQLHVFPPEETPAGGAEKASRHIERILDWLEAHYARPFALEAIADELHLSPYHISHLFKRHTGSTLSEYIAARRIREACALLANTDMPVGDIGRAVGGFSTSYFCQLFKKRKGVSPHTYRMTVRKAYER
jgi:AraC-like DNA-binding protein